jgi:AraC family transcriptional regulator, transcriptional activator of the genes for pyochelin and ferripyochelin receptors
LIGSVFRLLKLNAMETRQHVELEQGTRDTVNWEFDGIRMGHALTRFNDFCSFRSSSPISDRVRLHIGLRGNYSFRHDQLDTHFDLIGGHHNILYSDPFDMVIHNRTLELETFGVQFPRELFLQFTQQASDLLKQFSENMASGRNTILSDRWGPLNPSIQMVIHQILNHSYRGDLQKLFLLSKSIELLVLCVESCQSENGKSSRYIKNKPDQEKILAVRDLINGRVDCPPSLSEVAKLVGMNEYKLKRGFKETFHTTIFGYLIEQRLLLARQYLLDTNKTAAEISFDLGYSTPQHFNNAFKKRFGTTPDFIRKNP